MKNWITRLFKGAGEAAPDAPVPTGAGAQLDARPDAGAPAAPSQVQTPPQLPEHALDLRFWCWLVELPVAAPPHAAAGAAARLLLDQLARLAHAPEEAAGLVPRVPEVIPRLLRSLREESVSGADLARQVTQDAVLVAEVIREANGPLYRSAKPVRTVDAAILVLGQNGLRMLLARVAFRPVVGANAGRIARHAAPRLWRHAERCARAAALLAPALGADPFEAYLAGLMHGVGLVVALRLLDQLQDHASSPGAPPPSDPALVTALLAGSRQLAARIALHWELPPPIAAAILQVGEATAQPLARALGDADRLATLRLLLDDALLAPDDALLAGLDGPAARVFERLAQAPD